MLSSLSVSSNSDGDIKSQKECCVCIGSIKSPAIAIVPFSKPHCKYFSVIRICTSRELCSLSTGTKILTSWRFSLNIKRCSRCQYGSAFALSSLAVQKTFLPAFSGSSGPLVCFFEVNSTFGKLTWDSMNCILDKDKEKGSLWLGNVEAATD